MSAPLLSCRGLVVGHAGRPLLPPVEIEVEPGQLWAVLGRNGSGKSTWFRTVLGLIPPISGQVERADALRIAYIAQRMRFDDLYPVTVGEVVRMGCLERWGRRARGCYDRIERALEATGATALRDRTFRSLSEGQKQRALLARMVASEAQIAILDEPTAAMDSVAERQALELIDEVRGRFGVAVLLVSHNLAEARARADRVLFLDPDGQRVVIGSPREVFQDEAFRARYNVGAP